MISRCPRCNGNLLRSPGDLESTCLACGHTVLPDTSGLCTRCNQYAPRRFGTVRPVCFACDQTRSITRIRTGNPRGRTRAQRLELASKSY